MRLDRLLGRLDLLASHLKVGLLQRLAGIRHRTRHVCKGNVDGTRQLIGQRHDKLGVFLLVLRFLVLSAGDTVIAHNSLHL